MLAEGQLKVLAFRTGSRSSDAALALVAAEAAESGTMLLATHQEMSSIPQDDGLGQLLSMCLGVYLGYPGLIVMGAEGLLSANDAQVARTTAWVDAFVRSRAAQLMLPSIASRTAGEDRHGPDPISIDLDESFAASAAFDLIALRNVSGVTLNDCTVLVELRGADGRVSQNVHFVESWDAGSERFSRYGVGIETPNGPVGRQTVNGVNEVRVSLWCNELRRERTVYTYPGPERDRDVATMLEGRAKLTTEYVPNPFWGVGRCFDLGFVGVPQIPAHTITMYFTMPDGPKKMTWQRGEWNQGESRRFDTGEGFLPVDPLDVEIAFSFEGIGYQWRSAIDMRTVVTK